MSDQILISILFFDAGLSDILCKLQKGKECNMLSGVELQNSKRGKHIIKFPITINSSMLLNNRFELTT